MENTKKKMTLQKKQALVGWAFLLPGVILIVALSFYPALRALLTSFKTGVGANMKWCGITNYARVFQDKIFRQSIKNCFFYLIIQVPIMLVLGMILASLLNNPKLRFKGLFRTAIFLPCATSLVAYAIIFRSLFAADGFVNAVLIKLGILEHGYSFLTHATSAKIVIIIALIWRWTGYNMVFYLAGLQNIEYSVYEAAKLDGANMLQTFFKITMPLLKPTILMTLITSTNGTLQLFDESMNLTKGGPANASITMSHYIYTRRSVMTSKILYGGDYDPEQWLDEPEILEQDIAYMKKAKINTVTLGVFSWSALEPEEGVYDFGWLRERIDRLYQAGISTILATPSGARPKWLADQYPEVLRVRADRHRNLFGERHNHCYTSPVYREKVRLIDKALAEQFASHPAVICWHISNEYGGECHCPLCQEAFRGWLKKRYEGDIGRLNKSWWTAFWSHTYRSFDEIESPSPRGESQLHGLDLDWHRFVTEQTADFMEAEIRALRGAGAMQPATTNLMYDYPLLNYDRIARSIDIVSWDTYPIWHKGEDIATALDTGLQHDYMRCLKRKPFLLMESSPSVANWQSVCKLKKPGLLTAAGIQALAHGSESILYFQIRQSRGSYEKFHGAVIDHSGREDTRVFKEVAALGAGLEGLKEILGSQVEAEAAILYDMENRWALEGACGPRNKGLHYHEAAMKSYRALKDHGINVDVISQTADLSAYRLVVAPMLYMFRDGFAERLRTFVEQGGCFVLTYWSGIVDEEDLCFLGDTPHGVTDVFGLRRTETDGLYEGETNCLCPTAGSFLTGSYTCRNLCDLIAAEGGRPIMVYGRDFYQGTPAVVEHRYGKGRTYYVGADAEQGFYDELYGHLLYALELTRIVKGAGPGGNLPGGKLPAGIEMSERRKGDIRYIFVQNFSGAPVDIMGMELEGEILYGEDKAVLEAYGSLVLRAKG